MRLIALAILMALISVQTADAAVTFGRDRLKGTTKMSADPATPFCPGGTTLTNQGNEYLCIAKLSCPAGTTMQDANLCVAKPKCAVASDVVKDGVCVAQ
jgi:hypothetical protein